MHPIKYTARTDHCRSLVEALYDVEKYNMCKVCMYVHSPSQLVRRGSVHSTFTSTRMRLHVNVTIHTYSMRIRAVSIIIQINYVVKITRRFAYSSWPDSIIVLMAAGDTVCCGRGRKEIVAARR
jgi:hypothetical protein